MAENTVSTKKSFIDSMKLFFKGVKSEWKKIIFPSQERLINDSVIVVVASLVVGAIIFLFDAIISSGLGFIIK